MADDAIDPRLVALGLVPPPAQDRDTPAPAEEPPSAEPGSTAAPEAPPPAAPGERPSRPWILLQSPPPVPAPPLRPWILMQPAPPTQEAPRKGRGKAKEKPTPIAPKAPGKRWWRRGRAAPAPDAAEPSSAQLWLEAQATPTPRAAAVQPAAPAPRGAPPSQIITDQPIAPPAPVARAAPIAPAARAAPVAPAAPAAPPVDATTAIRAEPVRLFAHTAREGQVEVWTDHVRIGRRKIDWADARAVTSRGDRVLIKIEGVKKDGKKVLRDVGFAPTTEGVVDASLAKLVAEMVIDSSGGAPPRATLLRQLTDTSAELKRRFRDEDEQLVPLLVLVATLVVFVPLAFTFPALAEAPFRGGISVPPDTFILFPRLSNFDPRSLAGSLAGAAFVAGFAMRAAAGRGLVLWGRGTLAGWRQAPRSLLDIPRRIAATLITHPEFLGVVFVVALLLFLPSGRERTVVDGGGVHVRAGLPFFDHDVPWSAVTSARLEPLGASYAVSLSTKDGVIVDSRGTDFFGLSEYELAQFAERHGAELK